MNKMFLYILLFFSVGAFGVGVQPSGTLLRTVTASGVKIPVHDTVDVPGVGKKSTVLKLMGGGIREKKVVIASVNVYFLLNYTDLSGPIDGADPLKSLQQSRNRVLRMTFLRDLEAEKIRGSFSDALKENGVSPEEPALKSLLAGLTFDVKKGEGVDLIGCRSEIGAGLGTEKLQIVFPGRTLEAKGKTLVTDFWKIWFGKPADGGLEDLKPRLISLDQLMHM